MCLKLVGRGGFNPSSPPHTPTFPDPIVAIEMKNVCLDMNLLRQ